MPELDDFTLALLVLLVQVLWFPAVVVTGGFIFAAIVDFVISISQIIRDGL